MIDLQSFQAHPRTALALRLGLAVLAAALLVACGDSEPAEQAAKPAASKPAPAPAAPAAPTPRAAPKTEAPKTVAEQLEREVALPPLYPTDIPAYPGTVPNSVLVKRGRMNAVFNTNDSVDEVAGYMRDQLGVQGWENLSDQEMPTGTVIQGFKGRRAVSVLVSTLDSGGKEVTLIAVSADPQ